MLPFRPRHARIVTAAVLGAVVFSCRRPPATPPAVARVDGEPVAAEDLRTEIARVRAESEDRTVPEPAGFAVLRRAVMEQVIERRLLLAEAQRRGVQVADREVEEALARRRNGRAEELAAASPPDGSSDGATDAADGAAALRARTRDQLLVDRLLLREVVARTALGPDEARDYYKAHPDEFRRGDQVRVLHLVVPRREDAEALRRELTRGTDFSRVAREHSTSPDARQGGDLGFFERGRMPPEFDEACFRLGRGQVSDVVKTDYGFHLFKLTDRREASVVPFAKAEAGIELRLRRDAIEKAQVAYVQRLREHAKVEVFDMELEKVAP